MNEQTCDFDHIQTDIAIAHKSNIFFHPRYHFHDGYEIFLFLEGNVNYYVEQNCYRLQRGNLLVMRPDEFHRAFCFGTKPYERLVINLRKSFFDMLHSPLADLKHCFINRPKGQGNIALLNEHEIQELVLLAHKLQSSCDSMDFKQSFLAYSYLVDLLVKINCCFLKPSDPESLPDNIMPPLVADTIKYIEEHLSEPIFLEDIEKSLYRNGTYINRKFKVNTGLTIKQYIIHNRLSLAKSYLAESKSPLEACLLSGFNDYSNFCRTFTKQVGIPPLQYKKRST